MTDDPDAKKTVNQRLTALEHTLFGDQVAIMKYKKAVAGYVTPRGTEPPPGMITRMQSQLESITETLAGIQHRLTGLQRDVDNLDIDEGTIASKTFVDEGLARLSRALRDELGREKIGTVLEAEITRLDARIDTVNTGLRELALFFTDAMPKKIVRRVVKLLRRWQSFEHGGWILDVIARHLGTMEPRQ